MHLDEERKLVGNMLAIGMIQESNSVWSILGLSHVERWKHPVLNRLLPPQSGPEGGGHTGVRTGQCTGCLRATHGASAVKNCVVGVLHPGLWPRLCNHYGKTGESAGTYFTDTGAI